MSLPRLLLSSVLIHIPGEEIVISETPWDVPTPELIKLYVDKTLVNTHILNMHKSLCRIVKIIRSGLIESLR